MEAIEAHTIYMAYILGQRSKEYYHKPETDAVIARLETELEHQKELYAAHIGDEHDNCGMVVNKRLVDAINRLENEWDADWPMPYCLVEFLESSELASARDIVAAEGK